MCIYNVCILLCIVDIGYIYICILLLYYVYIYIYAVYDYQLIIETNKCVCVRICVTIASSQPRLRDPDSARRGRTADRVRQRMCSLRPQGGPGVRAWSCC